METTSSSIKGKHAKKTKGFHEIKSSHANIIDRHRNIYIYLINKMRY